MSEFQEYIKQPANKELAVTLMDD